MTVYKFDDFVFDSERYQLTHKGVKVTLRPKALSLLDFLIENRRRVVSKEEIFAFVWRSTYVRDHLLFQLISELRKLPLSSEFVRTQPNQGYQWNVETNVETKLITRKVAIPLQVAASVLLGFTFIMGSMYLNTPDTAANSAQLPAHSAFTKGVVAMQQGDADQAVEWFTFALNENPESVESAMFLAEALLQLNRPEQSSAQLQALLKKPSLDSYNKMTATDLLSRIRQRQGRLPEALYYAQRSSQSGVIAQCSADVVEQRFELLANELGEPIEGSATEQTQERNTAVVQTPNLKAYDDQCSQLKHDAEKTSYCEPERAERYYAYARREPLFILS